MLLMLSARENQFSVKLLISSYPHKSAIISVADLFGGSLTVTIFFMKSTLSTLNAGPGPNPNTNLVVPSEAMHGMEGGSSAIPGNRGYRVFLKEGRVKMVSCDPALNNSTSKSLRLGGRKAPGSKPGSLF